jgi:hypothetical protein
MSYRAYDLRITRESDTYRPRTYRAVLATRGQCQRFALYWLNPPAEIEPTDALAFSDFLFDAGRVWYWDHKDENRIHTEPFEPWSRDEVNQLPMDKDFASTLGAILAIVASNHTLGVKRGGMIEMSQFFQGAREHARFNHVSKLPAGDTTAESLLSAWAKGDWRVLNQLPFGRRYSKETTPDGDIVWRMSKATVAMERVSVTVRRMALRDVSGSFEISDPNTLGRWSAVPDAYRRYWSLKDRSIRLRRAPSVEEAQRLCADISSCLRVPLPNDLNVALRELLFTASLRTQSEEAILSSAREYFDTYVHFAQEPVERIVIELGRIAKELRARWSEGQTRDFIHPLLEGIVDPKVFADTQFVKKDVLEWIHTQGPTWSWYEQLVCETVQEVAGIRLESVGLVSRVADERSRATGVSDLEPNDHTPSADGHAHE